jgi:hypothetical protein
MRSGRAALALLTGLAMGAAHAQDLTHIGDLYLQGGTQGVGLGYAFPVTPWFGMHADINGFGLAHQFTSGDVNYDAHLHLLSGGTYLDLFPFRDSGFRVTAGAMFSDDTLSGNAVPTNGTYTFNGTTVVAPPGTGVSATVRYPTVRPYFGLGFGHKPTASSGFGFVADLGFAYGTPHVDYDVSPDLVTAAGANNVAAEEQNLENTASHWRFYPVLQVGVSYHF